MTISTLSQKMALELGLYDHFGANIGVRNNAVIAECSFIHRTEFLLS